MKKETEKRPDRHVRITDNSLLEMVDVLMQRPEYKSFNKVLNEALFYGLPILYEKVFGEVVEAPQEAPQVIVQEPTDEGSASDEFYLQVVRLLKEIVLTNSINKSMLSSIFNACKKGYKGENISGTRFEDGEYATTPDYLELYEIRGLKNIRNDKK